MRKKATMTEVVEMAEAKNWKPGNISYVYSMGSPVRTYWCPTCEDLGRWWSEDKKINFYCVLEEYDLSAAIEKFIRFEPSEVFCDDCLGYMVFSLRFNKLNSDEHSAEVYIGIALPYDIEDEIGRVLIARGVFKRDDED